MAIPFQQHSKAKLQQKITEKISSSSLSLLLKDKPFYIWDKQEHREQYVKTNGNCCFNHIAGLPSKDNVAHPLYDYEKLLFDSLFNGNDTTTKESFKDKHLWVLKSTGLGITEFFLRIIGWLCTKDDSLKGSQVCIVTGPRIELSVTLIDRLKALFYSKLGIIFANKETVLELNGVRIEVYPSHHLDSMRGLANVSFILLDEADFFPPGQQQDARDISERYIGKSNPYLVMCSTPNRPASLFDLIDKESEQECIYHRIKLNYTQGLNKIYSSEEIEKAKQSPSFPREYELKFLGQFGNVFAAPDLDRAINDSYDPDMVVVGSEFIMGIDPGFGSSAFAVVVVQVANSRIEVLYADQIDRPRYEDATNLIFDIIRGLNRRNIDRDYLGNCHVFVDASAPQLISTLKRFVGETDRWDFIQEKINWCHKRNLPVANYMTVVPVPFNQYGRDMLLHAKEILEFKHPILAIHPKFNSLITGLRTATACDDRGGLDKQQTSYDDLVDAFRLCLHGIRIM